MNKLTHSDHSKIIIEYFSSEGNHLQAKDKLFALLAQNCKSCAKKIVKKFPDLVKAASDTPARIILLERLRVITVMPDSKKKLADLFEAQLKLSSNEDSLLEACFTGNLPLAKAIHQNGVKLDVRTRDTHFTPLHYAAHGGFVPLTDWLLENKADLDAKAGPLERTPLHLACASGKVKVMVRLVEKAASLETRDKSGCTALHIAFSRQDLKEDSLLCARLGLFLFSRGARPNVKSNEGFSPIDCILKPLDRERYNSVKGTIAQITGQDAGSELDRKILKAELEEIEIAQFEYLEKGFTKFNPTGNDQKTPFPSQVWQIIMRHLPRDYTLDRLRLTCKTLNNYVLENIIRDFQHMSLEKTE